jgi:hypothetical protein
VTDTLLGQEATEPTNLLWDPEWSLPRNEHISAKDSSILSEPKSLEFLSWIPASSRTEPLPDESPMTSDAAQAPDSQESWYPHLADCFEALGPGSERLLPTKLKGSFPTFCLDSCYLGEWPESARSATVNITA